MVKMAPTPAPDIPKVLQKDLRKPINRRAAEIFLQHVLTYGSPQDKDTSAVPFVQPMNLLKHAVSQVMKKAEITSGTWSGMTPQHSRLLGQLQGASPPVNFKINLSLLLVRQNNYVDQDTGVVNWDSDLLNFNTHFHFWGRVSTFWNKKNAEWGPDLKSAGWMQHINKIITEERALYPNDPLPLIPLLATPTPPPVRRPTSDPLQEVTINGSVRTTTGLAALSNYRDDQRQPSGLTATGYSAHHRSSSEMYTAERTHHPSQNTIRPGSWSPAQTTTVVVSFLKRWIR
ncbi:hypothetical protein C8J57DRAFT_1515595 [Mycena rebaudengoi]|nr:hypothetical protein C8J57DRAFT_1515595 [Mycena rebaudengoi]